MRQNADSAYPFGIGKKDTLVILPLILCLPYMHAQQGLIK